MDRSSSVWWLAGGAALSLSVGVASAAESRSYDGSGNNQVDPNAGAVGGTIVRKAGTFYTDGFGGVDGTRPNARSVSNAIFDQPDPIPSGRGLSAFTWVWGQFLDHDISITPTSSANGTLSTVIPAGDPFFDSNGNNLGGESIVMSRSNFAAGTGVSNPREHVNMISTWIDASNVYGSDGTRGDWLRSGVDGRVKMEASVHGEMLPSWSEGAPEMDNTSRPMMGEAAFVSGDVRANEQPALLGMHTVFNREHNRLADKIAAANPGLNDEEIYQRARKIVGAQMQRITYGEYLPALGIGLSDYTGYNASVDPSVSSEFSTAAFRFGHTQVTGTFDLLNADGSSMLPGGVSLAESFFNPSVLRDHGIEGFFRGLGAQTQEAIDAKVISELRNQLFEQFVPGVGLIENGTDLVSLNIMRGRDHGLGDYNTVREAFGLAAADSFADMTSDPSVQAALALVYGSPDEVDVWVGMLVEDHLENAEVGALTAAVIADQFERLRDGDRFWWEADASGVNSDLHDLVLDWGDTGEATTAAAWLAGLGLSDVLELNLDARFQDNAFFAAPVPAPGTALLAAGGIVIGARRRRG